MAVLRAVAVLKAVTKMAELILKYYKGLLQVNNSFIIQPERPPEHTVKVKKRDKFFYLKGATIKVR